MRYRIFLAVAALMLSASVAARADDLYTISVTVGGSPLDGTYTFDEASILTSETTIPSVDVTALSGPAVDDIIVDPTSPVCPLTPSGGSSCVELDYPNGGLVVLFSQDLTESGTYSNEIMSVSIEPSSPSVTPEPSSIALLGTGLLGFAGVLRRRFVA